MEIKLPVPLARLANRPHGRYRLSAPAGFCYRGDEVAAQAASGAVRYDISHDPARGRWYIDASWKAAPAPPAPLVELRQHPVLAVDLNHGHLAAWVVTPDGNPAGPPVTIPIDLAGLPSATRDGRLRAAISSADRPAPPARLPGGRDRGPGLRRCPRAGPGTGRPPALTRPARSGLPAAGLRHPHRKVPGPAGPDDLQRRAGGDRRRPCLHLPVGPRALARPSARSFSPGPRQRPSCGRRGDRQACARPPGAATGRCDRRRPADQPPESYPQSARGRANDKERQAPQGQAAATPVAEDRDGQPDPPARPGDPRTVRGRWRHRTTSCSLNRNGSSPRPARATSRRTPNSET